MWQHGYTRDILRMLSVHLRPKEIISQVTTLYLLLILALDDCMLSVVVSGPSSPKKVL
jgi:hypothetical protein